MKKRILGQSLFEVVLALGLITLVMTAVVAIASLSIVNSSFSKNQTLATRLSESSLEWVRNQRDLGWSEFSLLALSGGSEQTSCFPELSWEVSKLGSCGDEEYISDTRLKREIVFSLVDVETIEVTVRIYWVDGKGYHETSSATYFTDWN